MAKNDNMLELSWVNKSKGLYYDINVGSYEWVDRKDPRVSEPRILIEKKIVGDQNNENLLIKGDNLLALKTLLPDYENKIKLIYIDPPYNTGSAFTHYDDGLEHSIWLTLIRDRIELLWKFLDKNGSIWVSIDDYELPYLRVLMDGICGRDKFIACNVWQKRYSRENREAIGDVHEYIVVYAKTPSLFKEIRNKVPPSEEQTKIYKNPNNDPRGRWRGIPITAQEGHATKEQFYEIKTPSGKILKPPTGRCWALSKRTFERLLAEGRIYFGKNGNSQPQVVRYLDEVEGMVPWTWWPHSEVGHTDEAKKEIHALFGKEGAFETPKPERLLKRIIEIASDSGDWVLDSFLGTGTSVAVAHKMGRRWIGIELGEHAETLALVRLKKVIKGEDYGGISDEVNWKGGGGFKYLELGDSLFIKDKDLRLTVLNPKMYNGPLIRAVLKIEGFKLLNPENALHGISGKTIAHVTEQYLNQKYIDVLLLEVGDRADYLVIYAKTISSKIKLPENVEVRRMPDILLRKFKV